MRGLLVAGSPADAAGPGDTVEVVLDRTSCYAEDGGQLSDQGVIRSGGGALIEVTDIRQRCEGGTTSDLEIAGEGHQYR
ncbi:MAG: alanine--tRNA ligase-related protein [Pseudonocardiaceae bacterium]